MSATITYIHLLTASKTRCEAQIAARKKETIEDLKQRKSNSEAGIQTLLGLAGMESTIVAIEKHLEKCEAEIAEREKTTIEELEAELEELELALKEVDEENLAEQGVK